MKKIVYLAPLALLSIGTKVSANQVSTHISNALRIYEQESNQNQSVGQIADKQTEQTGSTFSNDQINGQPLGKREEQQSKESASNLPNGQNDEQLDSFAKKSVETIQPVMPKKQVLATHISMLDNHQANQLNVQSSLPNGQNQPIGKVEEATHISRLDGSLLNKDSSVGSGQAIQMMKISRSAIPTKQELSESKDSVAGQYVQVQQNRVAQFNKGSQIYGLNNSGQLSKNNGDGYVIINAGTYNGRAVDIAVTINNVSEQQGNYTTEWSNGDYADITGKTDASFKYDNSALPGAQQNAVNLKQTRSRNETQNVTEPFPYTIIMHGRHDFDYGSAPDTGDIDITSDVLHYVNSHDLNSGLAKAIANGAYDANGTKCLFMSPYYYGDDEDEDAKLNEKFINRLSKLSSGGRLTVGDVEDGDDQDTYTVYGSDKVSIIKTPDVDAKYTHEKEVSVTDHLQMVNQKLASLNYSYTVGVYDAQTGELIRDLTANYKGKTGKTATDQDVVMNDAVKAKIQAINANQANIAYTGTADNDDITFNKNTVHVNYVDEQGQPIDMPGYDIDVDNLTSGNYQIPQNYVLANANGFKVTKNTHEINGITVTDSYNFIDQGHNKVTDNGKTLSVVLAHGTTHVDPSHSGLSNDATNDAFVINNGAKKQINSQSRHFGASGILDLVTNKISMQGNWQLSGKPNFDQTNINNDLVGYGNAIHSNLTFLAL